jgi:hypothetical protein
MPYKTQELPSQKAQRERFVKLAPQRNVQFPWDFRREEKDFGFDCSDYVRASMPTNAETTLRWALDSEQPIFGPVSVGQPRQGADFAEPALQGCPALAAVGAAVDLPEGRGGIDQFRVRRIGG